MVGFNAGMAFATDIRRRRYPVETLCCYRANNSCIRAVK